MDSFEIVANPAGVVVPSGFIGACCANIESIPDTLNYRTVRSWDYNGQFGGSATCVATFINPAPGQFSWATFDAFITSAGDRDVIFVLGAVPDYVVTRAAVGGSYKGAKGNMCPDNLPQWLDLVRALVRRARDVLGRTGILWQLWNEVDQSASYNDALSLLGPYTRETAAAIRAEDPTAIVIGPPVAGPNPTALPKLEAYLTASDGAGGIAADHLDGVACHLYNQVAGQISAKENPMRYYSDMQLLLGLLSGLGLPNVPVYVTETGVISANPLKGRVLAQRAALFAAMGFRLCLWYSYDGGSYDYTAHVAQLNAVSNILKPGAVIQSCRIGQDRVRLVVDNVKYEV